MTDLLPGFDNPVLDSQRAFRAVLEAMSRPGRVQRGVGAGLHPPAPLMPAAGAALLALADAATPLWQNAGPATEEWLRFHAGCPVVGDPARAAFALAAGAAPALDALEAGTDEAPERAATLLLQVASLDEGDGPGAWILSGPGIETTHALRVTGAPQNFAAAFAEQRKKFPRGVDVILCAGEALAALPRSTWLKER
jgi:alpha-D-ribose 1-methylphosphonate 5-triphosphate synthase subunit PhnH